MSLITRKTLVTGLKLLLMLQAASFMAVILTRQQDQAVTKREQTLQIDVAFIIHGSENITSPERKKTFKEALDWAKKITKSFGDIGINKTRAGLILYAEEAKLMFNFTENLDKGAVIAGIDEASSPPALGNETFTGRALKLALKTLVKQTRKDALKKFFVFTDRPSDDDPESPADAMKAKEVEVYGLGDSGTEPEDAYIHDYSLDSLYMMLKEGPYKGGLQNPGDLILNRKKPVSANGNMALSQENTVINTENDVSNKEGRVPNQDSKVSNKDSKVSNLENQESSKGSKLSNQENQVSNKGIQVSNKGIQVSNKGIQVSSQEDQVSNHEDQASNKENQVSNQGIQVSNQENLVSNQSSKLSNQEKQVSNQEKQVSNQEKQVSNQVHVNLVSNQGSQLLTSAGLVSGIQTQKPSITFNSINFKQGNEISGRITKENPAREKDFTKIRYGNDASVVITENKMKAVHSVGRYSTTIDESHSPTEFGTIIGGVRVHGQSKFDVIKPNTMESSEDMNLRSNLGKMIGKHHKRQWKLQEKKSARDVN